LVVAEIAQAHDGSLGTAHAYIDAAVKGGADAVKFQTHIAEAESSPSEPWRVKFSPQDESRYDYWRRMEFSPEQWAGLKAHADEAGILFLSSPFSLEAVDLLEAIGVCGWKLGAGETTSLDILRRVGSTRKPVLLSSGMSFLTELDTAVEVLRSADCPFGVYQCTSAYPCPPERIGLNMLEALRQRYGCPVGLSDHSGGIYAGLAAATLGADMLEVHLTFSRDCFGPDVPASVTPEELTRLTEGVKWIRKAIAHPVDKDQMAGDLQPLRSLFRKSAVALRDLPAGHVLAREDIGFRKPGGGLNVDDAERLLGSSLRENLPAFTPLAPEHVE
jgi:N-acetylneuraminate synthase